MRAQRSSLVVLAAALLASCASFSDLPSDLQQSAQCIAESLRSTPGISNVGLGADVDRSESQAGTFAVIRYSFVDETNEQHQVKFGLYKDTRIASGHIYNSAIAGGFQQSVRGSPASKLDPVWLQECSATGILITA